MTIDIVPPEFISSGQFKKRVGFEILRLRSRCTHTGVPFPEPVGTGTQFGRHGNRLYWREEDILAANAAAEAKMLRNRKAA